MIPIRLTIHNFMSYGEHETLDFSGFDLGVITGQNGAGKSSIMEAITWAIWDESRAGSSDELIRQGTTNMWVEFQFEMEEHIYRIIRKRDKKKKSGTTLLEFQTAESGVKNSDMAQWQQLTEGTIRVTQEKIIQALKLPYEIFVNSSYLRQGHADEFTIKTPAERKTILADILGLSMYDELEKKSREKKREVEARSSILQMQIEDLKLQLAQSEAIKRESVDIEKQHGELRSQVSNLEAERRLLEQSQKTYELTNQQIVLERQRFGEINHKLVQLADDKKNIQKDIEETKKLLATQSEIQKKYDEYQTLKKTNETMNERMKTFFQLKEKLSKFEVLQKSLDATVDRLHHLKSCPTCLRPLPTEEAEKLSDHLRSHFNKQHKDEFVEIQRKIKAVTYDGANHETIQRQLNAMADIETAIRRLAVAEETMKQKQTMISGVERQIQDYLTERSKISQNGQKLKQTIEKLKNVHEEFVTTDEKLRNSRHKLAEVEQKLGAIREKVLQLEKWQKEAQAKKEEIKQKLEDQSVWQELADAFSKKGVQAMIIEQTIPQIEEEANRLLQEITDGRLQLRFETQRQKKSGEELIETLDIIITDDLGPRSYELFSGGEAFRINFAIRIALSKLLSVRAGARLRFLVIDEGFGALDAAGRDDIVAAINGIRNDFAKVLIVTHLPEVKDAFQTHIEVKKDEFGSHISLVE